jgi:hypothetical protein
VAQQAEDFKFLRLLLELKGFTNLLQHERVKSSVWRLRAPHESDNRSRGTEKSQKFEGT